jgi:hypothetical protein
VNLVAKTTNSKLRGSPHSKRHANNDPKGKESTSAQIKLNSLTRPLIWLKLGPLHHPNQAEGVVVLGEKSTDTIEFFCVKFNNEPQSKTESCS